FFVTPDTTAPVSGSTPFQQLREYSILHRKNQPPIPVEHHTLFLRDSKEQLTGYAILFRDTSEQKKVETALLESRRRLKDLIHSVDGIVWEANQRRENFQFISNQVDRILGYRPEDWKQTPHFWKSKLHSEDIQTIKDLEERLIKEGNNYVMEYRLIRS